MALQLHTSLHDFTLWWSYVQQDYLFPCFGDQRTIFETSSSPLMQCPANLFLLSRIFWLIFGRLSYSSAFAIHVCCFQLTFRTVLSIRVQQSSSSFSILGVTVHASQPYNSTDLTVAANSLKLESSWERWLPDFSQFITCSLCCCFALFCWPFHPRTKILKIFSFL